MQAANDHLLVAVAVQVQPTRLQDVSDNPTMHSYTTCGKGLLTRGARHAAAHLLCIALWLSEPDCRQWLCVIMCGYVW